MLCIALVPVQEWFRLCGFSSQKIGKRSHWMLQPPTSYLLAFWNAQSSNSQCASPSYSIVPLEIWHSNFISTQIPSFALENMKIIGLFFVPPPWITMENMRLGGIFV